MMSAVTAYAHLVGAVLLVGYALFWVIMAAGFRGEPDRAQGQRLRAVAARSRWPYLPRPLQPSLTGVGWLLQAAMAGTGLLLLAARGISGVMMVKLVLVALVMGAQAALVEQPSPARLYVHGAAIVAVVVASAFLRG